MKREHEIQNKIPHGYTVVEWIGSSGTQYIDTGFKPSDKTKIVIKCRYTSTSYGSSFLGANPWFVITTSSMDNSIRFRRNNVLLSGPANDRNTEHTIVFDRNKAYIDDVLYCTFDETEFQSPYTMLLFARHSQNGGVEEKSSSTISFCTIYEDDTLVGDFVSVLDDNGTPCMFDVVTQKAFYNAGSGKFTYK